MIPSINPDTVLNAARSEPIMVVDLGAIRENFRTLRNATYGRCAAVVKGDGYGHGMRESAQVLKSEGADLFFTARFQDALDLRGCLGPGPDIVVLDGISPLELAGAQRHAIIPVINSVPQLEGIARVATSIGQKQRAFVHIDTAMNRLGLSHEDLHKFGYLLKSVDVQAYMTHFVAADDCDLELCRLQVQRIRQICQNLPVAPMSLANSSAVYLGREFHGDIIRPGKSTFGINPILEGENPLREPATVLAKVIQVRDLLKGESVGYSSTWRAPGPRRIATVAIGYANGYRRANSNSGHVAIAGHIVPVVGRVSMDLTTVDVTKLPSDLVHYGSPVQVTGRDISYRDLAKQAGTNEHEALIALGAGCRRVYIDTSESHPGEVQDLRGTMPCT